MPGRHRRNPHLALDGYGLRDFLPARPTNAASYPVSVRRVAISLHASFRRSLAVPPLRFTRASPPSGCTGDLHPQAAGHAQHTDRYAPLRGGLRPVLTQSPLGARIAHGPGRKAVHQPNKKHLLACNRSRAARPNRETPSRWAWRQPRTLLLSGGNLGLRSTQPPLAPILLALLWQIVRDGVTFGIPELANQ